MNKTSVPVIAALISGFAQGFVGIIVKILDTHPLALVSIRCFLSAGLLFAVAGVRKSGLQTSREIIRSVVAGVFLAGHWATFFISLRMAPVAVATTALFTFPVMMSIAEPLIYRQKVHLVQVISALTTMLGVWLITPGSGAGRNLAAGVAIGLLSALLFVIRNLICKQDVVHSDGIALMSWQTLTAGIITFPFLMAKGFGIASGVDLLLILVLSIVLTAVSHTVRVVNMRYLPVTVIDIISTSQVAVAAIAAWILLGEQLAPANMLGMALVLGTVSGESLYFFYRFRPPAPGRQRGAPL